eukprot:CAMPEP_0182417786 /NCGR_PEP_ID=MMETSP1167-20130531/2219_1 /TAXON_ID=2988 /ORGANISM="Mallomonas Sp, Strain CCMP3275" /LENGTH=380 /DNA_ID=CAMNT_0024591551 /DNA_START=127 /DNA_END=1266 /DNA_ORIENTATION=-
MLQEECNKFMYICDGGYSCISDVIDSVFSAAPDAAQFDSTLKKLVKYVVPNFQNVPENSITINPVHGGITNLLYLITDASSNQKALVRIFGSGMSALIDRNFENKVCLMYASHDLAPQIYGIFENGRIEEYISADTLVPDDLAKVELVPALATSIAKLHLHDLNEEMDKSPVIWNKLETLFHLTKGIHFDDAEKQQLFHQFHLPKLREELELISASIKSLAPSYKNPLMSSDVAEMEGRRFAEEVVLCHNDLLAGNFLRRAQITSDNDKSGITIIDFEYSGYNARAMDIANHFCEYAGFDCDYEKFPSKSQRLNFLRCYSSHVLDITSSRGRNQCLMSRDESSADLLHEAYNHDAEAFLSGFDLIICKYVAASHLFWGLW